PLLYLDAVWRNAPPHIVAITEHVARYGISYSKLATDDAALLDATVVGFFCPEGLEPILPYTDEHLEGLSPQAVDELLSRDAPVRRGGFLGFGGKVEPGFPVTLANFLATGRRHGTTELPDPQHKYFIFNQEEVRRVLEEVSGLLAVQGRWRTPAFEAHICAELLPALQRAAKNNLMLAGRYT
ncbi:MAG: hypothetical protein ACJ8GW_14990, partial [Massilia sp.]